MDKNKAFKEWWLLEAQNIVGVGRAQEEDIAKEGYRAALEEVLKQIDEANTDGWPEKLITWVRKELNG